MSHGIHSDTLRVGERDIAVRRDFDLVRRLEEQLGPLGDVLRQIEQMRFPVHRLVDLYAVACGPSVSRAEIEAHIMRVGFPRALAPAARLLINLFVGDDRLEQALAGAEREGGINPQETASRRGPI